MGEYEKIGCGSIAARIKRGVLELAGGRAQLILLGVMLLAAFAPRVYRLWEAPMDFHPTRQYIGAVVARAYYYQMSGSVSEDQLRRAQINKANQTLLEPQILPAAAAVSYLVVGGERLWIPRFYSVLAWLVGGVFLALIAREFAYSVKARICAIAIYWFMPFSVLNSRVFQPDPLMLLFMLAAYWQLLRYDRNPNRASLLWAALAAMISVFLKPVSEFPLFASLFALLCQRYGWRKTIFHPHLILFTAVMMTPAVIYYVCQLSMGGGIGGHAEGTFIAKLPLTAAFWAGWAKMIGRNIGLLGLLLSFVGIWMMENRRAQWQLGACWFGYACYGLVFNYHIHTHDYYSMMLIPIAALSVAPLLVKAGSTGLRLWRTRRTAVVGAGLATILLAGGGAVWTFKLARSGELTPAGKGRVKSLGLLVGADEKLLDYLGRGPNVNEEVARMERIGELVNNSENSLFLTHDFGKTLTYHGELTGEWWPGQSVFKKRALMGERERDGVTMLREKIDEGMRFFVATDLDEFGKQGALREELERRHTLLESNQFYFVFALRHDDESVK